MHQQLEQAYFRHGKGLSTLRKRLKNAGISTGLAWGGEVDGKTLSQMETTESDLEDVDAADASSHEGALMPVDDEALAECDGKAEAGNRRSG